jgi:hypothetical protein
MPSFTYTTRAAVEANVQADLVVRACDRNGDGAEDTGVYDALVATVGTEVEALVAPAVDCADLSAAPAVMQDAALKIVCDRLYRLIATPPRDNPWTADAEAARALLRRIGAGELAVDAAVAGAVASIDDDESLDWTLDDQADL